jgi:hypothetical protein
VRHFSIPTSKHFQLLSGLRCLGPVQSFKDLNHAKLLVRYGQNANVTLGWKTFPDSRDMNFAIFSTWAVPDVHAELEHLKSVLEHTFSETRVGLPIGFCFRRQVEHDKDPHDSIGV